MTEMVKDYVAFVLHPFQDTHIAGIEVFPGFYYWILLYTVGFTVLYQIVPLILSTYWTKWYNELEPTKRKEMPTYLISFVHHFIMVPAGWIHIYQDYQMIQSGVPIESNYYALKESGFVPLGCAFLLADAINSALLEAYNGKPLYLIHHVLTIALGVAVVVVAPGCYLRLVPHFFICETTNIFFNIAWVLRAAGWKGNPIVLLFEYLFALSFFPIRIFNLSLVIYVLQGSNLGLARYALHPIGAMQYFWFYKIISMVRSRYCPPTGDEKDSGKDSQIHTEISPEKGHEKHEKEHGNHEKHEKVYCSRNGDNKKRA